ncbi:MAG TPA: hypothetical protein VFO79_08045, partial [Xanthomonadales bacterium]|nr:hypothetical protein [Xanthomonadales bacterium]
KLETAGALRGDLAWARAAPLAGTITLDEVTMHDADGRFALDGVDGRVPLGADAARDETLRWRSAALHRIPISGGSLVLRAQDDRHALAAPLELALLDGRLRITRFALVRDGGARRIEAALALDAISVDALTRALGWPAFGGSLSGTIPALRSEGDVITFEGGLSFDVFGGRIEASALTLERAFGVAPSLAAELAIEDLDLEALTSAFSFGTITGRLDGRIAGLRLLDWSPVAFDLSLATDPGYEGRKRISQRAVGSLSAVGGAGAAGGIQRGVMGIFDTFPYAAIGLTCRLRDNVCEMGGLDSENGGYTIVRGAGLPRLTVVGHQRRVDWPVLVARLKAATEGDGPVVE